MATTTQKTASYWSYLNPFAYHPITATGEGIAEGVEKKLREAIMQNAQLYSEQVDLIVSHALLRTPPKEITELKDLCRKLSPSSSTGYLKNDVERVKVLIKGFDAKTIDEISKSLKDEAGKPKPFSETQKQMLLALEKDLNDKVTDNLSNPLQVNIDPSLLGNLANAADLFELIIKNNQGVVVKALELLHGKGSEIAASTIDDHLNSLPHKHLTKAKILTQLLKEAFKAKAPDENFLEIVKETHASLIKLEAKKDKIFKKAPLQVDELKELQTFKTLLGEFITPTSSSKPSREDISKALKKVNKPIILKHFKSEEGVMARTMGVFLETLTPILVRLEKLPQTWMQHVFNTPPSVPALTSSPPPSSPSPPLSGSSVGLDKYLGMGAQLLEKLSAAATNAVSQKAIKTVAEGVIWGLKQAQELTKDNEAYKQAHTAITLVIPQAEEAVKKGSWKSLLDAIKNCLSTFNAHQIYLNGVRIPRFGGSNEKHFKAISIYSENLKLLNKNPGDPLHKDDYQKLIELEKKAFDQDTSFFISLKVVYESLCRLPPPNDNFYYHLLEQAGETPSISPSKKMRELFFAHLDDIHQKGKISIVTKGLAKMVFRFLCPLTHFFIKLFSKEFIDDLQTTIKDNLQKLTKQSVVNFNRYLEILGSAYERVANTPVVTHTLTEMLEKELQNTACNLNFSPEKLYSEVAKKCCDRYCPKMMWRNSIKVWIDKKKPLPSTIPKKIAILALNVSTFIFQTALYLPEKICNLTLNWGIKRLLMRNQVVNQIVEKSTTALKDPNGYTHALNCVLHEQMQKILDLMKKAFAEKNPSFSLEDDSSLEQHEEFTALVKNLFTILRKDKCSVRDDLVKLLKRESLSQKVRDAIDDFIVKDTVEASARLIKIALDSILEKDQIESHILNFFAMVNRTYKAGKPVSPHEFKAMEQAINSLSDDIITVALEKTLSEKLDFTLDKQTKQAHDAVQQIKSTTQEFLKLTSGKLREIETYAHWDHWKSLSEVEALKQKIVEFQQKKINELFRNFSNRDFDIGTKKCLDEYNQQLATYFQKLNEALLHMHTLEEKINLHQRVTYDLVHFQQDMDLIQRLASSETLSEPDLLRCKEALKHAENLMLNFPSKDHLADLKKDLTGQIALTKQDMDTLEQSRRTVLSLSPDFVMTNYALDIFKKEKLNTLDSTPTEQQASLSRFLTNKLNQISHEKHKKQLLSSLEKLSQSTTKDTIEETYKHLKQDIQSIWETENEALKNMRTNITLRSTTINKMISNSHAIDDSYIPQKVLKIKTHLQEAQNALVTIDRWANDLKDIPMLNISLSDMDWLRDWAQNLAYSYVKKEVEGLIRFARRPHNTRFGIFHHSLFLPFIQSQRA